MTARMMGQEKKTYTFHVSGTHCAAGAVLIEQILAEQANIESAKVFLSSRQGTVIGIFSESPEKIAEELSKLVQSHGYAISVEKQTNDAQLGDFAYAVPIAAAVIIAFLLLQKAGLTSLITSSNVSYGTAFVIGLIASVSSCLAIV